MNRSLVLSLLINFLGTNLVFAGQDVGKGGDAVRCGSDLYALDFLVFSADNNPVPVTVTSYEQSLFRIRKNLANKLPELLSSFDEYTAQIFNTDPTQKYVWESAPFELTPIDDQALSVTVKIPETCRINHKIALVQAVIRQNPSFSGTSHIIFKYMPDVVKDLNAKNPVQLSFLLVHEWLWSHSDNVDRNRRINWLLHSSALDSMNRNDLLKSLAALGFDPTKVPVVVDPKGFGTYRNLQEALLNYQEGQTLLLKEGTFSTGGVAIQKPVTIVGDGDRGKIIIVGNSTYPALAIESSGVIIRNLTLKRPSFDTSVDRRSGILESFSAQFTVENCQFKDSDLRTLVRLDGKSSGTFRKNDFIAPANLTIFSLFGTSNMNLTENSINQGRLVWNRSQSKTLSIVEGNTFGEGFDCFIDRSSGDALDPRPDNIILKSNIFRNPACNSH